MAEHMMHIEMSIANLYLWNKLKKKIPFKIIPKNINYFKIYITRDSQWFYVKNYLTFGEN